MMTRIEFEQELVTIIQGITGLADGFVRVGYQLQGQPTFKTTENVILVAVTLFDSDYDKPIEKSYKEDVENDVLIESRKMTVGYQARLTIYGSSSVDNALKIKAMVQDNSIMKNLRANEIFLISSTPSPQRVPILLNQQWYEQVTLDLRFYAKVVYNKERNYIESVEVTIVTDTGEELEVAIVDPRPTT